MQPFWYPLEEALTREAEHVARAERARLARAAGRGEPAGPGTALALRTAHVLRQLADHLEAGAVRPA
jgi:hypothetical protein